MLKIDRSLWTEGCLLKTFKIQPNLLHFGRDQYCEHKVKLYEQENGVRKKIRLLIYVLTVYLSLCGQLSSSVSFFLL